TEAIEAALERLADDVDVRRRLMQQARTRPLRSWREYADDVVATLGDAPLLRQRVLIEGSHSVGMAAEARSADDIRRLHWRKESRALLPGRRDAPELPSVGAGRLHDVPAVLTTAGVAGPDELAEIVQAARGLGLRLALRAEPETSSEVA